MAAEPVDRGLLPGAAMPTGMVRAIPRAVTEGVVTVAEAVTDFSFVSLGEVAVPFELSNCFLPVPSTVPSF